jgi:hypothetical protein
MQHNRCAQARCDSGKRVRRDASPTTAARRLTGIGFPPICSHHRAKPFEDILAVNQPRRLFAIVIGIPVALRMLVSDPDLKNSDRIWLESVLEGLAQAVSPGSHRHDLPGVAQGISILWTVGCQHHGVAGTE